MSQLPSHGKHAPAINEAVPFAIEELFFSRTDEKGIILSGNSVFQHISQYSWDELLNKPHNLIRHPDMPKAVFWLLWDTIKKGEPIGAYVKNKARDGRYYWVFAIVTPIEGGYLSVRLKPSSPVFSVVEREYAALVALENRDQLRAADSAALLLERLSQLGFKNYSAFMATALGHEIAGRDEQLKKERNGSIVRFGELVKASQALLQQSESIFNAYEKNEYVPLNLRVQAAQLGEFGATIGVISNNYSIISNEIKSGMDEFIASAEQVFNTINSGLFLVCTSNIQREVLRFFHEESSSAQDSRISQEKEMAYLEQQQKTYQQKAIDGLFAIARQAERFHHACVDMKRLAAGLEVTRIMGKVESSRLNATKDGLDELIGDLETFQVAIADGLREIEQINRSVQYNIQELLGATQLSLSA